MNVHEYRAAIDGMIFGADPKQGYFKDNVFLHPEMRFRFEFPKGWQTVNQRAAVIGPRTHRRERGDPLCERFVGGCVGVARHGSVVRHADGLHCIITLAHEGLGHDFVASLR